MKNIKATDPIMEPCQGKQNNFVDNKKPLSLLQNIFVGSVSGAAGITLVQPMNYFKTIKQTEPVKIDKIGPDSSNSKTVLKGLKQSLNQLKTFKLKLNWYRGLGCNIASFSPVVAFQTSVNGGLSKVMDPLFAASISGILSAVIVCPTEGIMIQQQKTGKDFKRTVSHIFSQYGITGFYRAIVPTMIREGVFTAAYLGAVPLIKKRLTAKKFNEWQAHIIAGTVSGSIAAIVSHPFDTNKTQRQGDFLLKAPMINAIFQKEAFAGLGWRVAMIISLSTIMSFLQEGIHSKIDKISQRE